MVFNISTTTNKILSFHLYALTEESQKILIELTIKNYFEIKKYIFSHIKSFVLYIFHLWYKKEKKTKEKKIFL